MTVGKYDVKRVHRAVYSASAADFTEVDVPELSYLTVDGAGDPNVSGDYADAVAALYSVSYAIKFASKAAGRDAVVGPLEGLWWAEDRRAFVERDRASWKWRMMIAQPPWITDDEVAAGMAAARGRADRKKERNSALGSVVLRRWAEGRCLQILHVGPYSDEGPTLARLHDEVMPALGVTFDGEHHEIYLSDPRRTAPEKLKTILRQPITDS